MSRLSEPLGPLKVVIDKCWRVAKAAALLRLLRLLLGGRTGAGAAGARWEGLRLGEGGGSYWEGVEGGRRRGAC